MKIFRKKSSKIFSKFIPCLSTSAKLKNFAEEDMLVEKSGRGGYAHEFPPRLPRWYFSFIGVLLAEVLWQGMSVFGILFWNFSNLSTRKNMHFKNFYFFITFWQKIGIFFSCAFWQVTIVHLLSVGSTLKMTFYWSSPGFWTRDLGILRQTLYPQGQLSMEKLMKVPLIKLRHLFIHSDWKMKNFSIHA